MLRVLVLSSLFPNAAQPNHGVFVENRLRETLGLGGLEATVVAPAPYFPSAHPFFGRYAVFARIPDHEVRHGLEVWHPRYLVVPKVGGGLTPWLLYRAALSAVRRLQKQGLSFDVIDAHYFYPDGVAAARLGRALKLPVVITGRGTDLTLIPEDRAARRRIRWAAGEASATITVCDDLRRRLIQLGGDEQRAMVLRNGVDLDLFKPGDRLSARLMFNVTGFTLLSVGALIPRKGHDLTIEALRHLPDCTLLIAGSGPLRADLEALAARLGVADRVRFLGELPHASLPSLYTAADAFVLASSREGWANVLLEAMACGTPVVATDVNGTGEVVRDFAAGLLMPRRSAASLAETVQALRGDLPARHATRRYAEQFGWRRIGLANRAILQSVGLAGYARRHAVGVLDAARAVLSEKTSLAEPRNS